MHSVFGILAWIICAARCHHEVQFVQMVSEIVGNCLPYDHGKQSESGNLAGDYGGFCPNDTKPPLLSDSINFILNIRMFWPIMHQLDL